MGVSWRHGWAWCLGSIRAETKQRLPGITKRGDPYLRMLLVHGARSVVYRSAGKTDRRNQWIAEKQRKLGTTKACVAVANKNARIIWALLAKDEPYRVAA